VEALKSHNAWLIAVGDEGAEWDWGEVECGKFSII